MAKKFILSLLVFNYAFAINIHTEPSETSTVVAEVDNTHELTMSSPDWVQIKDEETGSAGWVKFSELKKELKHNSQWSYTFNSDSETQTQLIKYKPLNEESFANHIADIHQAHADFIKRFENLWDGLAEAKNDE